MPDPTPTPTPTNTPAAEPPAAEPPAAEPPAQNPPGAGTGGQPGQQATPPATDGDQLGEGGMRALESERNANRQNRTRISELEAEIAELKRAGMDDHQRAIDDARREGAAERDSHWQSTVGRAVATAEAATTFADPDDAHRYIDEIPFTQDGAVEVDRLRQMLADVLERKPHLRRADGAPPAPGQQPPPSVPTGVQNGGNGTRATVDEVKRMTPQERVAAYRRGDLDHLTSNTT